MEKITLEDGTVLDPNWGFAPNLDEYAKSNLSNNMRVFLATDVRGKKEYILVEGQNVIFADANAETVAAHIDILKMNQDFNR
jgi:hypothetical protein